MSHFPRIMKLLAIVLSTLSLSAGAVLAADEPLHNTSELSYESYIHSDKPIKCLYGYAAEKVGDHDAAIAIFEDCIERFNSVYAMIWLAQIYDTGVGVPRDEAKATALLRQGALTDDEAGYSSLAKYHYGIALIEGKGTQANLDQGKHWLELAAKEGVEEAKEYLSQLPPQ